MFSIKNWKGKAIFRGWAQFLPIRTSYPVNNIAIYIFRFLTAIILKSKFDLLFYKHAYICHEKLFKLNVQRLCFEIFSLAAAKMASQKLPLIELKVRMHF